VSSIIGDAKVKVSLDTSALERDAKNIPTGSGFGEPVGSRKQSRRQSLQGDLYHMSKLFSEMSAEEVENFSFKKYAMSRFNPGRTATFEASAEAGMAATLKAAIAAYAVKEIVDTIEQSPKFVSFVQGLVGMKGGVPIVDYLSDEITKIKASLSAFMTTKDESIEVAKASLRLGQHVSIGGARDLMSFLYDTNLAQEKMQSRIDKEIDKDIMEKLGEAASQAFGR
jgi:hypothetical protein